MPIYKKRYRLDDRISETPGSQVYKGQDLETRQWVVVKKISFNPYVFESEISFLKKLNHPNIVRLLDYFEEEDSYYIVTEWFDGIPVTQHSLSEEEWTDIFISIVKGIQYIHENGVIHRDLKPQNILVSDNKQVKIIDFGISVFQKDIKEEGGKILGTLPYMSPEQTGYLKSGTDIRSDLYSLGVIFYECLSGENPFLGQDKSEIIHKHLSLTPTPLHKKAGEKKSRTYRLLGKIISNLLEKDPVNRYQSSEELVTDLERILQVKFPLHGGAPKVVLREKLVREAEEKFHKLAKNPKGLLLIQGKYGAGKTFLFKNVLDSICESAKVLEFKVIRSTPFSFGEKLLAETGESPEETQRILEMRLPVLAIENIQRMDEPSWNLLMQRKNLLIIGTRDEDESFENLKNTSIPREEINLAPYTLEEVSEFINRVFSNNISIPQSILQKIYHFSKGNLEILIYLLKLFYREKILVYREKKWVFEKAEQIFSSVEETSILNYRFSKLDQDFLEFMKSVAIYGFSFNLENLKKFHTFLRKKPMEIKRCLKMAEEQSILEKTGNDYVFLNKNIHQYFLRLTPEEERIEKHLRIAKTIERLKTIKNRFFPLFYHYSRTYEYQKAYVWGNRLILELVNKYSYQQATEVFEKVIGFFEKIPEKSEGDYIQFYELLQNMINIYIFKGDYEEIIQILKQQSEFLAKKREKERISNVYLNLGKLFTLKGQLKEARDWFQKAEEISHALNQPKLLKSIYENTSMNYLFSSRFREAIRYFEKAQQFYQKEDYQQSRMITFLGIIAFAYGNIGLYEKAEEVLKRLESLIENEENPHLKYIGLHYRVLVLSHIGDVNALNEDKLRDALERVEKEGNKLVEYSLYFSIGYYYYKKKKLIKAFDYVSRSVSIGGDVQVEVGILAPC
jgi:serine/threonine protein kinase